MDYACEHSVEIIAGEMSDDGEVRASRLQPWAPSATIIGTVFLTGQQHHKRRAVQRESIALRIVIDQQVLKRCILQPHKNILKWNPIRPVYSKGVIELFI